MSSASSDVADMSKYDYESKIATVPAADYIDPVEEKKVLRKL